MPLQSVKTHGRTDPAERMVKAFVLAVDAEVKDGPAQANHGKATTDGRGKLPVTTVAEAERNAPSRGRRDDWSDERQTTERADSADSLRVTEPARSRNPLNTTVVYSLQTDSDSQSASVEQSFGTVRV